MNFFTVAQLLALAAAQNTIEWSTYSFYSSLAGDYQCLLPYLPDSDAQSIEADPQSFISQLTASPATYYAGLLGLTTGCVWSGANAHPTATSTGDSDASSESSKASSHPSETSPATDVASANRAAVGVAGAGAMAAAFFALL